MLAAFVPRDRADAAPASLGDELAVLARPQVWLGLAMTVFGFAGVLVVFTFVQPLLTGVTGLSAAAVSPAMLLFGAGLAAGNLLGGRLADKSLMPAVLGTMLALALVLASMDLWIHLTVPAMVFMVLLGVAAFATVAPLQMRVLDKAAGAGQNLASSLNIAAFNLGNALGAWIGGVVIDHGPGLRALGWVGALLTLVGLALAFWSRAIDRREVRLASTTVCA